MKFIKAESYGNDFAVLFKPEGISSPPDALSRTLCARHTGVGADGLIVITDSENADLKMRIFNPDGSEAEMCGNALRISVMLWDMYADVKKSVYTVETLGGKKCGKINESREIETNIGLPSFECESIPLSSTHPIIYRPFHGYFSTCMSFGNPHIAVEYEDLDSLDIEKLGASFENDRLFPKKTNVHFYKVLDSENIMMRPWERACGETLGCSTGSAAVCVAANISGKCGKKVCVRQKGGDIKVEITENGVIVTGKAHKVFEGDWENEAFRTV